MVYNSLKRLAPLLFSDICAVTRSSHWGCSIKKGVLKNYTNFTGKHLSWSLFLIKLHTCFEEHLRTIWLFLFKVARVVNIKFVFTD